MSIFPSHQASISPESMSKSFTLQPAVLSSITNLPRLRLSSVGESSDFDSNIEHQASGVRRSSRSVIQPANRTAETVAAKRRPAALNLGPRLLHPRLPTVSIGFPTDRLLPSTPALTSSSRSVGTEYIDTLEVELHHHQHDRKVTKGSILDLPIPELPRHSCGGTSHTKSQVIEMFSPKNTMSYLTSPQGAQASHQCNQDISEAFIQMKLDYKALAHDWPIENENYAIRVSSDLGMRW
jgi:hypothetical protein